MNIHHKYKFEIVHNGDSGISILFEESPSRHLSTGLNLLSIAFRRKFKDELVEIIPAYTSLTLIFNIEFLIANHVEKTIDELVSKFDWTYQENSTEREIEIPVCYDEKFAPDIQNIVEASGLSKKEVIKLHSSSTYFVNMLGFLPGFFYLSGLNEKLFCPRKTTPELNIPAGSVGIGGEQTGVYPVSSPGGWQIIGRTPVSIFSPDKERPFLVSPMDRIRFVPISANEFESIRKMELNTPNFIHRESSNENN